LGDLDADGRMFKSLKSGVHKYVKNLGTTAKF